MASIPYFDAHCDTVSACLRSGASLRKNKGHLDLARLRGFSPAAQIFALYADGGDFAECRRQHNFFLAEMAANSDFVRQCQTAAGIRAANGDGRAAALLSVEGGELLDCDLAKLETAKGWGVVCVSLTWNHENALSGSHIDRPDRGLSARGRGFVREAERLGIFLDVSHLSDAGFYDLADMASRPILATHSDARAITPHSRNLTDDMFRIICRSGGAAGINFFSDFVGSDSLDGVIRHIEHFLELGGEKHLCLGGDLDGCSRLAGLSGAEDIPLLWDALSARGWDRPLLEDLFFGNLLRILDDTERVSLL